MQARVLELTKLGENLKNVVLFIFYLLMAEEGDVPDGQHLKNSKLQQYAEVVAEELHELL
jgi:hypothetical protein